MAPCAAREGTYVHNARGWRLNLQNQFIQSFLHMQAGVGLPSRPRGDGPTPNHECDTCNHVRAHGSVLQPLLPPARARWSSQEDLPWSQYLLDEVEPAEREEAREQVLPAYA